MNDLSRLSWSDLMDLRNKYQGNQSAQDWIAPYEHRAWAREQVSQNPLLAPVYAAAVPAYQLYKLATDSNDGMTSKPSLRHLAEGWRGTGEGLQMGLSRLLNK